MGIGPWAYEKAIYLLTYKFLPLAFKDNDKILEIKKVMFSDILLPSVYIHSKKEILR